MDLNAQRERNAYDIFKRLRNRLRKLHPTEVVHYCIHQLNPGRSFTRKEMLQQPPWFYFLILKWVLVHGDFRSPNRRALRKPDMEEVLGMLHELWGAVRLPNDYDSHYLFFRSTFQQQLWLQEDFLFTDLGRQSILFLNLPGEHSFRSTFHQAVGVELSAFLELSFALVGKFTVRDTGSVREEFFESLSSSYPPGTISAFVSALSRDLESIGPELAKINPERSVLYEFIELTPLRRFPLLKIDERYFCYCNHLLYQTLQNFVYDVLREMDANSFTNKFGPIFERYLEMGLSHASLTFLPESKLAKEMRSGSQLVDFAILTTDAAVLIDAKAVELSSLGMLAHRAEVVADRLKPSVLKAIGQGFDVANQLRATGRIEDSCPVFLLVVTYKDLLLGSGSDFYQHVGLERIDQLSGKYGGVAPIPMEHIFFLSINDFDLLMEHLRVSCTNLSDFLRTVVRRNSDFMTSSIVFRQHIPDGKTKRAFPQYLTAEFARLGERLRVQLQQYERTLPKGE